jgi:uncharacterized protein YeaO (DUF488 family)
MIKTKRAYEPATKDDGYRVLIDRLWPRGVRKSDLVLDAWVKEIAPSAELRKSFGHEPSKWKRFSASYRAELRAPAARQFLEALAKRARRSTVTLVYSARDEEHNDAVVLRDILERMVDKMSASRSSSRKAA